MGRVSGRLLAILLLALLAAPVVRAEVPNRTPEQLESMAATIVVAAVVDDHVSATHRRQRHLSTLRVLEVEKGDVEVGDEIRAAWFRQSNPPGTAGTAGHRGTLPRLGLVVRAYVEADGDVVLPNGFQPLAAPRHVTDELLAASDAEALRAAARAAVEERALLEAERAARALVDGAETPEAADLLLLSQALAGQRRFADLHAAIGPAALDPAVRGRDRRGSAQLVRAYVLAAWELGDEMYAESVRRVVDAHPGRYDTLLEMLPR